MNGDARLRYSDSFSRWQGEQSLAEGGILLVWMDNTTFSRYARFLLRMQGIVAPTVDQRQTAVEYCQDIPFWLELAKVIADPLISMRVLGSAHPGNYERETMPQGDVLHWSAPLQCWVARTGRGARCGCQK